MAGLIELKWALLQHFWLDVHHPPDVHLHLAQHVLMMDIVDAFHLYLYKAVMEVMKYGGCLSLETLVCSLLILPLP